MRLNENAAAGINGNVRPDVQRDALIALGRLRIEWAVEVGSRLPGSSSHPGSQRWARPVHFPIPEHGTGLRVSLCYLRSR